MVRYPAFGGFAGFAQGSFALEQDTREKNGFA
jgi:hypothetical protein